MYDEIVLLCIKCTAGMRYFLCIPLPHAPIFRIDTNGTDTRFPATEAAFHERALT